MLINNNIALNPNISKFIIIYFLNLKVYNKNILLKIFYLLYKKIGIIMIIIYSLIIEICLYNIKNNL